MHWSTFCTTMMSLKGKMSRQTWQTIRREGIERFQDRLRSGYADAPLDFSDLIQRAEDAVAPRLAA